MGTPGGRLQREVADVSDDEVRAVNAIQEAPSTSLTGEPEKAYRQAKDTITRWDPFNGVTVKALEE